MGFSRNPTKSIHRSGHTTHQLSAMIYWHGFLWSITSIHYLGFLNQNLLFTDSAYDLCTSALASWNMPVFLFSFRNGPQDPKAFATWYVLKAYFLSMRIRAHSIFPYLQKKFSWRKNAQAHKNYLGLLGIKSSKPIPLQNQLFRRVLRSQHF